MPLVKRWQPQVEQAPLPRVQQVPQDWGGVQAISRTVDSAVDKITAIQQQEQQKADHAFATQQIADFTREADALLLDPTKDPDTGKPRGYKFLQGEDAFAARDTYAAKVQDLRVKYAGQLQNEDQKRAFEQAVLPRTNAYLSEIQGHAGQAADKAQAQAYTSGRQANLGHVLGFASNPEARAGGLAQMRADALTQAGHAGLYGQAAQDYVGNEMAENNAAVLGQLIQDRNLPEARKFYAQTNSVGGFGVHAAKATSDLRVYEVGQEGFDIATQAAKFKLGTGEVDTGRALAFVDKAAGGDAEKWKSARAFLEARVSDAKQAHEARNDQMLARVLAAYTSINPATGQPHNSMGAVQVLAPDAWAYISNPKNGKGAVEMKRTIEAWDAAGAAQATAAQAAQAIQVETWLYDNKAQVAKMPPGTFSSQWTALNPATGQPFLSRQDYQRLGNLFAQLHNNPATFQVAAPQEVIVDEMRGVWPELKGNDKSWQPDKVKIKTQLETDVERRFGGTKPDPTQLRDFVKDRLQKVTVEGRVYGTNEVPRVQAEVQGKPILGAVRTNDRGAAVQAGAAASLPSIIPPAPTQVVVVGPQGQVGSADAAGLDAWLASHPGWRKQ